MRILARPSNAEAALRASCVGSNSCFIYGTYQCLLGTLVEVPLADVLAAVVEELRG